MVHLLEKSFFFSLDTTRYNMIQPKSQNTQQTSTNGPNLPSPSVRLYATLCHSKPSGQDLVHCLSKAVLCLPSRSTEHFTQNHQWQSTILRYPSFKGRTIRDNPPLNQLNQLNYIGWIKIMMTSCKDTRNSYYFWVESRWFRTRCCLRSTKLECSKLKSSLKRIGTL